MVQQTSLHAYFCLQERKELGRRQRQIYDKIMRLGSCTNAEISFHTHLPINCVTPRVKELRDKGLVMKRGCRPCNVTNNTATTWGVI
jgi:DNA-binding MarR family transcriptional regulator